MSVYRRTRLISPALKGGVLRRITISVRVENDGAVVLAANREGMLSLANHFAALAEEPPGSHIHFDENNALEENSVGLIVERRE